jgi:hypothetical protein
LSLCNAASATSVDPPSEPLTAASGCGLLSATHLD